MTRQEERFYCISCGKLVTGPMTDIMFRTGFFRIVHPMCYCQACSTKEDNQISRGAIEAADRTYDYKMLLRGNAKVAEYSNSPYST